jgi:hypothetical protein
VSALLRKDGIKGPFCFSNHHPPPQSHPHGFTHHVPILLHYFPYIISILSHSTNVFTSLELGGSWAFWNGLGAYVFSMIKNKDSLDIIFSQF